MGKGTVISELLREVPELELSVSATTRPPREGEVNGRDYHFVDEEEFERLVARGAFLEHADYSGHRYGTLRSDVEHRFALGKPVVLEIEVQGARQIRERLGEAAVAIFLAPPEPQDLRRRLEGRGTDSAGEVETRLETARSEMAARDEFDHVVINDDVGRTAAELGSIVRRYTAAP